MVDQATILDVVERRRPDLTEAAKELIGAANRGGGEDNITVIFFELAADPVPDDTADTARNAAIEGSEADEDTLDEFDGEPVVEVVEKKRRGALLPVLGALAVLLIAAAAVLWILERL
jgi:hypothetical protein